MTSAAVAVTLACRRKGARWSAAGFGLIALVFGYTLAVNVVERANGVKIASVFIAAIVGVSLVSRVWRSLELRVDRVELDGAAERFLAEMGDRPIHLIAYRPGRGPTGAAFAAAERNQRDDFQIPADEPVLFLEVYVRDASSFRVLRAEATAVPNAVAALLFDLRDQTKKRPAVSCRIK